MGNSNTQGCQIRRDLENEPEPAPAAGSMVHRRLGLFEKGLLALAQENKQRSNAQVSPCSLGLTTRKTSRCNRSNHLPQGASRMACTSGISLLTLVDSAGGHIDHKPLRGRLTSTVTRISCSVWSILQRDTASKSINELLGTKVTNPPSGSTNPLLVSQLDVARF